VSAEALLAIGYALFLLAAAATIDLLARHSHLRSLRFRTAGFTYQPQTDAWECPEGQQLLPHEHDHERRLVRYRGRPQVCNACPRKAACTDSDEGREVVRVLDPWPHSEAGRFHRGIALVPVALAVLICAVELVRNHAPAEVIALGAALTAALLVAGHLASAFLHSPVSGARLEEPLGRPRGGPPVPASLAGQSSRPGIDA
jgi:hypothetical protein